MLYFIKQKSEMDKKPGAEGDADGKPRAAKDDQPVSFRTAAGKAKGRLHRRDFETEEWAQYNDQKEAMPKAASQSGVKMQDGRKTKKNKEQKLNNDLHMINKIISKRKGEG